MLARLFDRPPTAGSRYPSAVWRYLDTPLGGGQTSIRTRLMQKWERESRLPPPGSRDAVRNIDLLTTPVTSARPIEAEVLRNRLGMLADIEGHVAELNVALEEILREVRRHS